MNTVVKCAKDCTLFSYSLIRKRKIQMHTKVFPFVFLLWSKTEKSDIIVGS